MKILNIKYLSFVTLVIVALCSCEKEDRLPQFTSPNWEVLQNNYSLNMTAVIAHPLGIKEPKGEADKMAAFVEDECRGVANIIDNNFYITIKGTASETTKVTFKYYNEHSKYLYEAKDYVNFEPDCILGTDDDPEIISFKVVK